MDRTSPNASGASGATTARHIANLKILSRLLAHELRAQSGPRLNLSREEVTEIQTSLDLYIEESVRRRGSGATRSAEVEVQTVPARMN